jgi:beta-lactamase class A
MEHLDRFPSPLDFPMNPSSGRAKPKLKPRRRQMMSPRKPVAAKPPKPAPPAMAPERPIALWMHGVRAGIVLLGASTIAGTILLPSQTSKMAPKMAVQPVTVSVESTRVDNLKPLKLEKSIASASNSIQALLTKYPNLQVSGIFTNDRGDYITIDADRVVAATRTIELPIALAIYQDLDRQTIDLEERLKIDKPTTNEPEMSVLAAISKMLGNGDPVATNLLIQRLGGKEVLTNRFRQWGLKVTAIDRLLPDGDGKNPTTATELATLIQAIDRGNILSAKSRTELLNMLRQTSQNPIAPAGLPANSKIASKFGDIRSTVVQIDAIELPDKRLSISAIIVDRPNSQDTTSRQLTRQLAELIHPQLWQSSSPTQGFTK